MQAKVAPLYFHSNKNCFISLSKTWTSKLPRDKILPFEVSTEDVTVYVSWAGSVSGPGQNRGLQTTDTVEINGLFGSKLGLKHTQEVLVTPLPDATPCDRVYVEPISVNDWEILEMHSSFIESNLLNQIRVIWAEQTLPVWVQKSICVFVKIGRIESSNPSAKCYLLGQNTEVVVSPKVRSGGHHRVSTPVKTKSLPERTPTPQPQVSLPDFSTDARDSKQTTDETPAHATDALKPDQEDPLLDISGFSSLDNSFTEELSEATNPEIVKPVPVKPEVPQATSGPQIPPAASQEDITPGFDSGPDPEPSGIHQRFMRSISSWWNGDESSQDEEENSKKEEKKQKNLERDVKLDGCFRICALPDPDIHDVDPLQTNVMSPDVSTSYLRLTSQPTNVYVSRRDVLHLCPQENVQTLPSSFLATMLKLESPTEKSERLKEKMNKRSERTSALRKRAAAGDSKDMLEDSDTTLPCQPTVVRVIVLDCNQETSVTNEDGEKVGGVNMKALSWLPHNHVIVHNLLRKQLGLETSARVHLTSFRGNPHEIRQLTLYRMFKKPPGFTKDMFETVFEVWLSRASNKNCPLLITQGTVVKCWLKEGLCGEFLLTFNHKPPSSNPPPLPYVLLTEGELDKCQVKVEEQLSDSNKPAVVSRLPYYTTDQIDTAVPNTTVSQLGGVGELISAGLEHIAMCLACTPLTSYIFNHQRGVCNGGILICGLKGGGKTSLAHALCNQVASISPWPYVVTVECKSLKGKRTENIRTHLESIFNELAWRQPAVLLLDDVDCIMSAASGPEQEMSGEAQYFTKNAEVLKELLLQEKRENTRLAVVATCKSRGSLHPSLTSPTGHHLFQETINIKPPNQETRRSILESVLTRRNNVNVECVKELDLGRVARKTEGFVARDLESAIDRAIHANLVNRGRHRETEEKELTLNNTDLDTALEDFTPAALRNVSLHKAGDLGWCDVGGLHDVRHALVQTLEWPAKYPKLFASCPLRLRSGLLLYGAPGTGKTLLAGVVAKECGLNFISIKGPELLSKYIGASEQAVRDTFNRAQSARPCILFFDEFDSLAPRRGHDSTGVTDRVVNQLLTQLDGVEGLEGVYVLAATSRPDLIDPALLRPGRLDKALHCGLPAKEERFEILRALTRNMDLSDDIDLGVIAEHSMNMTGADFKALLYNAQLEAVHQVTDSSVDDAPEEEQQSCSDTTKFVYLPNLEEGVTTLPPEKHAKLLQQVETCLAGEGGNRPAVEVTRGYAKVVVCQKHLENALSNLSPSVTDAERQKYQRIYEHFVSSRGGNFSDGVQTVGKRATLA